MSVNLLAMVQPIQKMNQPAVKAMFNGTNANDTSASMPMPTAAAVHNVSLQMSHSPSVRNVMILDDLHQSLHTKCLLPFQYGPRYNWSSHDQSLILGAYFYGYLVTSLPAGVLAERFGPRNLVGSSLAASALLTALTPLAATYGMWTVVVNRAALGICGVS